MSKKLITVKEAEKILHKKIYFSFSGNEIHAAIYGRNEDAFAIGRSCRCDPGPFLHAIANSKNPRTQLNKKEFIPYKQEAATNLVRFMQKEIIHAR